MPANLSCPKVVREIEVGEEHGLNEVSLFNDLDVVSLVKSLNLVSQSTHNVRFFGNFLQALWFKMKAYFAFLQNTKMNMIMMTEFYSHRQAEIV